MTKKTKTLLVVESPNKIKKISSFLDDNFIVRASYGHISDLATNDKRTKIGVDVANDFTPIYRLLDSKKDKLASIIDASNDVKQILLATDPDREGEAIAWHLFDALESSGKPIWRVSFNEITKDAVTKAVASPRQLDKNLYDAQQARRVVDRIVGFLASDYLREAFSDNLSAGRVQSVAAKLIVDRDLEIENFKKEEFWNINANLSTGKEEFKAKLQKKISSKEDADKIKNELEKNEFIVSNVEAKEKKRKPLPPLTTASLQQFASSRFGFAVAKTMQAAQALYEAGMVTYIRTDSPRLSPESLDMVREWMNGQNIAAPAKPNVFGSKGSAQDAHEAIRPTDIKKLPQNVFLDDEQQKIYRLIWERFVASQMEDAIYDTVALTIKSGSLTLKASGRTLKKEGWLNLLPNHKNDDDDSEDALIPVLKINDVLKSLNIDQEQKFTQPPSRFTESTLVKELERRGIGRPSTYADIIEKIKGRNYVELKGKSYHSTELGRKVILDLAKYFAFMDYDYTANMENDLDKIADGELGYVKMLDSFYKPFKEQYAKAEEGTLPDYGFRCEKCQSKMLLRNGMYGYYMACCHRPKCSFTFSVDIIEGKPIRKEFKQIVEGYECPKCNSKMFRRDGKFGPFLACVRRPECDGKRRLPYGKKCPSCNAELYKTLIRGAMGLSCTNYPNCTYNEDLPKEENSLIDPKELEPKKKSKVVEKVLSRKV